MPKGYAPITRAEKKMLDFLNTMPERFSAAHAVEIGAIMGISRATVYRYLANLQDEGLLSGDWGSYSKTN